MIYLCSSAFSLIIIYLQFLFDHPPLGQGHLSQKRFSKPLHLKKLISASHCSNKCFVFHVCLNGKFHTAAPPCTHPTWTKD